MLHPNWTLTSGKCSTNHQALLASSPYLFSSFQVFLVFVVPLSKIQVALFLADGDSTAEFAGSQSCQYIFEDSSNPGEGLLQACSWHHLAPCSICIILCLHCGYCPNDVQSTALPMMWSSLLPSLVTKVDNLSPNIQQLVYDDRLSTYEYR